MTAAGSVGSAGSVAFDEYPTRDISVSRRLDRRDPVLHGSGMGPLSARQLAEYERDGVVTLEGFLTGEEVGRLQAAVDAEMASADRTDPRVIIEPDDLTPRSLFGFHEGEGPLASVAGDRRVVQVAEQILGSEVYVHQSRINFKPAFEGAPFHWHSDFETWHAEDGMPRMRAVSCAVALSDNRSWNGPLLVMPGSHRTFVSCVGETPADHHLHSLRHQRVGVPSREDLTWLFERCGIRECLGDAGAVTFFDCNAMHGSGGNISPTARHNLFLVFNSVENRLTEPFAAPSPRPGYIAAR